MHQNPLRPKKDLQLSLDSVLNQKVTPALKELKHLSSVLLMSKDNGRPSSLGFPFGASTLVVSSFIKNPSSPT